MPKFYYEGTDNETGAAVTETVTAADRFAVYEAARAAGHKITRIRKVRRFSLRSWLSPQAIERITSRVSGDDLVVVTRNLGGMLDAGLPLSRALSVIERQSKNLKIKQVMQDLRAQIERGNQFHEALESHPRVFHDLYRAMVHAGEESGSLSETLNVLATQLERSATLKKKVRGAMVYPAIVITIMVVIGILMMVFVMPSITTTFEKLDVELPVTTQVLIATSTFLTTYPLVVLATVIGVVVFATLVLRTGPGTWYAHYALLHLPVIGTMVKEVNAARTARTLASLSSAGVGVVQALAITRDVLQNVHYKPIIAEAEAEVKKGAPLSAVFQRYEHRYPVFVGEMVLVGEETGKMATMLQELAEYYEAEIERKTKNLSTIIEPLLMVVVGVGVGFFALAMIAPIYSISDSF